MTLEIELRGVRRRVEVEARSGQWVVQFDHRTIVADLSTHGGWASLLIGDPAGVVRASYEVRVERSASTAMTVHVGRQAVPLDIIDPRRRRRGPADAAAESGGGANITAPMPGRVMKVLVKRGDQVAARQGVAIVEAMKMENEVRAPRAGVVADVRVSAGDVVEGGAILVVIE